MILPPKEFWPVFKNTEGALSCCEAIAIMNIAAQAPNGLFSEYGTYKGKSALSALCGLPEGIFYLYEPDFDTGKIDKDLVAETLKPFSNRINHLWLSSEYSIDAIPQYDDYSYVFIDSGSHQDGLPMQEVKLLEDRMIPGGIIAFHDWNSQFKEVKEASDYLVSTEKYEYIEIGWAEIINYVRDNDLENGNQSWHHTEMDFPCFVGAVKRL